MGQYQVITRTNQNTFYWSFQNDSVRVMTCYKQECFNFPLQSSATLSKSPPLVKHELPAAESHLNVVCGNCMSIVCCRKRCRHVRVLIVLLHLDNYKAPLFSCCWMSLSLNWTCYKQILNFFWTPCLFFLNNVIFLNCYFLKQCYFLKLLFS